MSLDEKIDKLILQHGVDEVLAALCRHANGRGSATLFRKLNRIYEWLTEKTVAV